MYRFKTNDLISWKNNPKRKPLIVKGVRQCGKTYLLKNFGKNHYKEVAYFNFESNKNIGAIFDENLDVQRIILELEIHYGKKFDAQNTLIIFDEIQFCNAALTSLKYFCEDAPEYNIVCAGSLLGITLSKPLSFPVGKVEFIELGPMCFHEFLLANQQEMLVEYIKNMNRGEILKDHFTDTLKKLLKNYYVVGGMPEVVGEWIQSKDIEKVDIIQQRILDSYELDFAKHAPSKEFPKLSLIWQSIPNQLAKENNKFVFSHVKSGARAKDLEDAVHWLVSAGLIHQVFNITQPSVPLSAYAKHSTFKLYLVDIGLLRRLAGLEASIIYSNHPMYTHFKGAMTENFVLTELIRTNGSLPYYWTSRNTAEVDFIVQIDSNIVPIEVKSEANRKSRSLAVYREKYKPEIAVKTSMEQPKSSMDLLHIPLYLLWNIRDLIKK